MEPKPYTRGRDLNHVARIYDPIMEKLSFGRERRFREKTIEHMKFAPTDRILDVGCGTGTLTIEVAKKLTPPGEIVGLDAAPKMIDIARKKAARAEVPATFVVGVSESLPFEDASFDMVVHSMFAHHIDRALKQLSFAEMYRVLKDGGVMVTADIDKPTNPLTWLIGWASRYMLVQKAIEDNLRGELPALIEEAGFKDLVKMETIYGMVSFFRAHKPGSAV